MEPAHARYRAYVPTVGDLAEPTLPDNAHPLDVERFNSASDEIRRKYTGLSHDKGSDTRAAAEIAKARRNQLGRHTWRVTLLCENDVAECASVGSLKLQLSFFQDEPNGKPYHWLLTGFPSRVPDGHPKLNLKKDVLNPIAMRLLEISMRNPHYEFED